MNENIKRMYKGVIMTDDECRFPAAFIKRVVVAYDAKNERKPMAYILTGLLNDDAKHDIRLQYSHESKTPYYQTRVILFTSYIRKISRK